MELFVESPTILPPACARNTSTSLALRDYQLAALDAVDDAATRGLRRQLLVLPTGSGKTIVFAELIRRRGGRALVLVHRDELARQAEAKIRFVMGDAPIGIVKAARNETQGPIVIASVQTVCRPSRLAQLGAFDLVIVDEAHHAIADSYRTILEALGAFVDDGPLIVGVTATADRADGRGLADIFEEVVFEVGLLEMIEQGYLANLRALQIRLAADFERLHTRAGDFIDREAEDLLLAADAPLHAVRAYQQHAPGRKALVFTSGVALAHAMTAAFTDAGIAAAAIDGTMPLEDRRRVLAAFQRGNLQVVSNCAVLTEGFDEPSIDAIIIARPTKSRPLYQQMIGRGTRPWPGKGDCLVLDLVGATTRHDLVTAATLFGVEPAALEEDSVLEAVLHQRERDAVTDEQAQLVAHTVDLFRQRRLHWIHGAGETFILGCGPGQILLRPEDGTWNATYRDRDQTIVIAERLPLDYAQGAAEDYVRRTGAQALVDPRAAWRTRPASERQLQALRRFRLPSTPGLTAGEASDQLARAIALAREARS
jgi:superfamily II DNA or RNA helicase